MIDTEHTRRQLESMLSVEMHKATNLPLQKRIYQQIHLLTEAESSYCQAQACLRKTIATCERFIREEKGE